MNVQNKWMMNRAGLINFWYYDEEIFNFANGKMLLRGSNGSGKSVTMQSILPVLLDGRTAPDRLDPFGSKARKIEDYLLGEKEIVNRDERTGYLFLEYKRKDTEQYMTTGIGLQARRHKDLNFWGFIITDNRRIGKDFFLYEYEYHAGEKQKIPLSRIQLENRIDSGGHVVRTRREYRDLVNKYIFRFETIDAYEDLIKLLIQLRSPKLSKDFKPTVIYEILEAALPPLTEEDLRHLSDTIDNMDHTKQQIEQLERERLALNNMIKRYDTYNEYRLAEAAHYYLEATENVTKNEKQLQQKRTERKNVETTIKQLEETNVQLEQRKEVLNKQQQRLEKHEVWDLQTEKENELDNLLNINEEIERKDKTLLGKTKREVDWKETLEQLSIDIDKMKKSIDDTLIDLSADAAETSFQQHELNVADFKRTDLTDYDFTVWKKEAETHYELLGKIAEQLREYERILEELIALEQTIAEKKQETDRKKHERSDLEEIFEKDKLNQMNNIHRWQEANPFFQIETDLLQQTARDIDRLYNPVSYETIRQRFFHVSNEYQQHIHEKIAMRNNELTNVREQRNEVENELHEWKTTHEPDPPYYQYDTKEARTRLEKAGHAFIPFYEAVEFHDHINEKTRKRIEAACIETGVLNALIMEEHIAIEHDRIIRPNPQLMAHTLADYLKPDEASTTNVSRATIEQVLQSILVTDEQTEETMAIGSDGTYKIGLLEGHALPVDTVRFIGRNARKKYREEQIERLTEQLNELRHNEMTIQNDIQSLHEKIKAAQEALDSFPHDDDLHAAYKEIETYTITINQLEQVLNGLDKEMDEKTAVMQHLKRTIQVESRELTIEQSHEAYEQAIIVQRRYEKDLNELEKHVVKLQHTDERIKYAEDHLHELDAEIIELKGELSLLNDRKERTEQHIAAIEKQINEQGMENIRTQIAQVQQELKVTSEQLNEIRTKLPAHRANIQVLHDDITSMEQKLHFYKKLEQLWSETFENEINYKLIELREDLAKEDVAKSITTKWKHLLNDAAKIEEHLTKVYYAESSNLMEFRMTEYTTPIPKHEINETELTDEQKVLYNNWKERSTRRIIQLDYLGEKLSPYLLKEKLDDAYMQQQHNLNEQDRRLYEEILFDSVGKKLRSRISRAEMWTKQMNELMKSSVSTSGITFSIQWKPRTAETEAELDTRDLVRLLRRDPRLLKQDDLTRVTNHFRSKIENAKELMETESTGSTLLQVLQEVLDYRHWFSFVLSYKRENEPKRELTNNAFYKFSGGEKAMAMYIPLFTAAYSRYLEADEDAPFIISLDEAFAGVDDENINVMFRIVEELGFDYIMNSQFLWGDYDTVSSLAIYELLRPKNADFVSVIRYLWNGKKRMMITDKELFEQEVQLM